MYLPLLFFGGVALLASLGALIRYRDAGHSPDFVIPTSFGDLQRAASDVRGIVGRQPVLSVLFLTTAYIFKQTFAVPGSALLNALLGIAFGTPLGMLFATLLSAAGATAGYLLSYEFGGGLLRRFGLEDRIWQLRMRVEAAAKRRVLLTTLLSMRVFPGTPHWALNFAAPHAGVPIGIFAATAGLGMLGHNTLCVYAGDRIATTAWSEVFSWRAVLALAGVALLFALPAVLPKRTDAFVRLYRRIRFATAQACLGSAAAVPPRKPSTPAPTASPDDDYRGSGFYEMDEEDEAGQAGSPATRVGEHSPTTSAVFDGGGEGWNAEIKPRALFGAIDAVVSDFFPRETLTDLHQADRHSRTHVIDQQQRHYLGGDRHLGGGSGSTFATSAAEGTRDGSTEVSSYHMHGNVSESGAPLGAGGLKHMVVHHASDTKEMK